MKSSLEDLRVLQIAESIADGIWELVAAWKPFARDVVGGQLARAADSIGANIAESFGRFHYGEKLNFLYYARGSLFETKYWLNRPVIRDLISPEKMRDDAAQLTDLARQLNAFAANLKSQRRSNSSSSPKIRETQLHYESKELLNDISLPLFNEDELKWLQASPNL